MAAAVVIPARFGSTRFPAKILASDTGKPLVQHVVEQVRKCRHVREILVATDDERIAAGLRPFDTKCVMTSPAHQSGTDRIAEAAYGLPSGYDLIINVQGDEPEIEPEVVDGLIMAMEKGAWDMATAATPFPAGLDVNDPNLVKVVVGLSGQAVYFSRAPIPYFRDRAAGQIPTYYLHLGIYAYTRECLHQFASRKPTPLEQTEKLEQLRAIEHGQRVGVLVVPRSTHGIDTPEQYRAFVERVKATRRQSSHGLSP